MVFRSVLGLCNLGLEGASSWRTRVLGSSSALPSKGCVTFRGPVLSLSLGFLPSQTR